MDLYVAADPLVAGSVVRVHVRGGTPHGSAAVEIDDGGRSTPRRDRVEVALDEHGEGWRDWRVPSWEWANLNCDGCDELSQSVVPSPSLLDRLAVRLGRAARAIAFIAKASGGQYGIGWRQRLGLVLSVRRIHKRIVCGSTFAQHLLLIREILRLPPSLDGDIVECGCADGGFTASLSLACALTGRRLFVCDSFEGLPEPRPEERYAFRVDGSIFPWRKGDCRSSGGLEGVKNNVSAYGAPEVCHFVAGYFEDTLGDLPTDAVVLVFEDADLTSSVETCLRHLWPRLQPGCRFYCHEPWSIDVVSLFYDRAWWKRELGVVPPGFSGSGLGLPGAPGMGVAEKLDPAVDKRSALEIAATGKEH